MTKPFVILSLSGGGYRGLYTCSILEKIEAARGGVLLSKSVDLVVGTSIGGIIALGLANEISAKKMREAFESKGPKLFKCDGNGVGRRLKRTGATMRSLALSKFRPNILEEIVEEFLGTSTLNELKMPAAVASVCVNRGQSVVFRNYNCKTGVHAASDAALATSAAPTYFPPHWIENNSYVDGGIVANNPDIIGIMDASSKFRTNFSEVVVISIGAVNTDVSSASIKRPLNGRGPFLASLNKNISFTMEVQQHLASDLAKRCLGNRYLRITTTPGESKGFVGLDVADDRATRTLLSLAESSFNANESEVVMQHLLNAGRKKAEIWKSGKIVPT